MDKKIETAAEEDVRKKADARASLLFGVIFAALIVLLIAAMAAIDIYGEDQAGVTYKAPADAADR